MTPPSGASDSLPVPVPGTGRPQVPKSLTKKPSGGSGGGGGGKSGSSGGPPNDKSMPLMEHLVELRRRLLYALLAFVCIFVAAFPFASDIFLFLAQPIKDVLGTVTIIYTAPEEKFFVNIRISFFTAIFVSFPLLAAQIWLFVAPGLYENEKGAFRPFLLATPFMFVAGAAFAYYLAIPIAFQFFAGFQLSPGEVEGIAVELVPRAREYLATTMVIIMAFGIAFELPILLVLLIKAGIVSTDYLARNRRYSIILAVVVAALLTPPDPISQVGLALPMMGFYEISILIGRRIEARRRAREDEGEEDEDFLEDERE